LVDFRLTTRRDAKAAKALLRQVIEPVRLHRPVSICTEKARTYRKVIREVNRRYDPHFDYITHIDKSIETTELKATLQGIKTIKTIKSGHIQNRQPGVRGKVAFIRQLFGLAA
jgi:IS6 family transposase